MPCVPRQVRRLSGYRCSISVTQGIVLSVQQKYMDGNAVQIGGAIVDSGKFDWTNARFTDITEPDEYWFGDPRMAIAW